MHRVSWEPRKQANIDHGRVKRRVNEAGADPEAATKEERKQRGRGGTGTRGRGRGRRRAGGRVDMFDYP